MKKINRIFKENKMNRKKSFIPYIMLGDGGIEESYKLLDLYVRSGAQIIEIGVPFSDSTADGVTIQAAGQRALENKITITDVLNFINLGSAKYPEVAYVIMTYLNPVLNYGISRFFPDLSKVGCSGIIIPDLPIEEYDLIYNFTIENSISIIPLISLDSNATRIKTILSKSSGFIYAVTLKGITGTKEADEYLVEKLYEEIVSVSDLPVVAGFGINTKEQVKRITKVFDGVVVASQLINLAQENKYTEIAELINCI